MNMISQLRQRVIENGKAEITVEEFNQLQSEWIMRVGAEDMVIAERAACVKVCEARAMHFNQLISGDNPKTSESIMLRREARMDEASAIMNEILRRV